MDIVTTALKQLPEIYIFVVFLNAILSWFVFGTRNFTVRRIYWFTSNFVDPVLNPIRRLIEPVTANFGFDISPFILIMLLHVMARMLGA